MINTEAENTETENEVSIDMCESSEAVGHGEIPTEVHEKRRSGWFDKDDEAEEVFKSVDRDAEDLMDSLDNRKGGHERDPGDLRRRQARS